MVKYVNMSKLLYSHIFKLKKKVFFLDSGYYSYVEEEDNSRDLNVSSLRRKLFSPDGLKSPMMSRDRQIPRPRVTRYARANAQVVTNLQQTCSNAVPTTCQQDVFALLVPSLLTTCYKVVELNSLFTSCSKNLFVLFFRSILKTPSPMNLVR
jgi:hypothetical protein